MMGRLLRVGSQGGVFTTDSRRVPQRVWRPSAAREALGFSSLVKARGADPTRVERVPLVAASAEPFVLFAGRPAAQRAADARRF